MKIAVTGKGGVGKTVIAGVLALSFARAGLTTIAIDADPTPNLAQTLGYPPDKVGSIIPVSENAGLIRAKTETSFPGVYSLNFSVRDIIKKHSVPTPAGVNLLVMGAVKSMDSGCSCAANTVVRNLVRHVVVERDESVVLDMEAGLEHIGRGTTAGVDCILAVSDSNAKSLETAGKIAGMARDYKIKNVLMAGNRVRNPSDRKTIASFAAVHDLTVAGYIPFDPFVVDNGIRGGSVLELMGSPALIAIGEMGRSILDRCRPAGKSR